MNNSETLKERIEQLNAEEKKVLEVISKVHYLPRKTEFILNAYPELNPEWRYNKAIKNLKARGFLTSIGVDCNKGHNEKDAHILTRRGIAACKVLNYELNAKWSEMSRYPKHFLRCTICENFIRSYAKTENHQRVQYITARELYDLETEKTGSNMHLRGLSCSGIIASEEDVMPLYFFNEYNYVLLWEKERYAVKIARKVYEKNVDCTRVNWLNRIIIVGDLSAVKNLINTTKNTKWFKNKDGIIKKHDVKNALYYKNESVLERGKAYVLAFGSYMDFGIYYRPTKFENRSNKYIKETYIKQATAFSNDYIISCFETANFVVFNLCVVEIHNIQYILNILEKDEEKRNVIIFTTENQQELIKVIFSDRRCRIISIPKEELENE